ncbi:MAG: hypothetical protein QOC64_1151, partial [Solirubrobacteraceae bacterium]|nr:hypothetical protein [Solirubrobacteraceae bacterium]
AALSDVGPVVPRHGFPEWYEDRDGLRLVPCVENDDAFCSTTAPEPGPATVSEDPAQSNFPDETFYWAADAQIDRGGTRARLVLAQEAAFANDAVAAGDQITFGRIRVRLDGVEAGRPYTVTHPYGTERITADRRGRARMTDDVGCEATPCDVRAALATRVGPFLRWDPRAVGRRSGRGQHRDAAVHGRGQARRDPAGRRRAARRGRADRRRHAARREPAGGRPAARRGHAARDPGAAVEPGAAGPAPARRPGAAEAARAAEPAAAAPGWAGRRPGLTTGARPSARSGTTSRTARARDAAAVAGPRRARRGA